MATDTGHYLGVKLIRWFLPKPMRKEAIARFQSWYFNGDDVSCSCCGGSFQRFLPFGVKVREFAQCPGCYCLERHRSIWLYLQNHTSLFTVPSRVLHFAPETIYEKLLKQAPTVDYLTADIEPGKAMTQMDVMNIDAPDNSFDVVLCNHVLEHVQDDRKAMAEIFRVLKPGGWAILDVPMNEALEKTFEDPTITDPKQKEIHFGQSDHVRMYGQDYKDRLTETGFSVSIVRLTDTLSVDLMHKYGLSPHDIHVCTKPITTENENQTAAKTGALA